MSALTCTITVSGELSEEFDEVFADLVLSHGAGTTQISGALTDQAQLQGVLHQIFDLGLEVLSIATQPGEVAR